MLLAVGGGARDLQTAARPRLTDIAPTLLAALGIGWDEAQGGSALGGPPRAYGPEEEALVAERLRRLGYLE
jgi:hypothetical protein